MVAGPQVAQLRREVRSYRKAAFAKGTHSNLKTQLQSFLLFCTYVTVAPFPASCDTVSMYIAFLSRSFKAVQSIQNYVSGVRFFHILKGLPFPDTSSIQIRLLYKGLSKTLKRYQNRRCLSHQLF